MIVNKHIFVHPSSYIDDARVGAGSKIWHFSHIQDGAQVGRDCVIGQNVNIGPNVIIGHNVKIQNNVSLYDGTIIEDDVFIGPSAVFTNVINPRSFVNRKNEFKKIIIRKGASIGANATIICGNQIGEYAFVGAGSVVTKDVGGYQLVYGCPAKFMGYICQCGNKLPDNLACPICDITYKMKENELCILE